MSENTSKDVPNNDQIIDDITKDLRDAQFTSPEADKDTSHIPEDFDHSDTEPEKAEDESDDELLKTEDLSLTDEEKEGKRQEAVSLKNRGNEEYKNNEYLESITTYTSALKICPLKYSSDRAVLYANRAASKIQIERKQSAIDDCTKAVKLNDKYVRAYLRRAKLYEESDKLEEGLADYKKILELDPGNKTAIEASCRLPPLIDERNEKLKTEMLGKLKDLGNMFLRPFGLSTDNFNLQQDPNSGGYSVNFQQKSGH